jgi:WD40 repeat-containing protein SMU1
MLQFCKEHNLTSSLRALQEETKVTLNAVDSVERFVADVQQGKWESVLAVTQSLTLPTAKMIDLLEQIVLELAEMREVDTARALLRAAPPLQTMKKEHPERYLFLDHLLTRTASHAFDASVAYPDGSSKDKRRNAIALGQSRRMASQSPTNQFEEGVHIIAGSH